MAAAHLSPRHQFPPSNKYSVQTAVTVWGCISGSPPGSWAFFLSLAQSKLRLCSANHRAGYVSNLTCDWLSTVWDYFLHHCFLSLAPSKLRLCSANHRAGYVSNLTCDWLSTVWDYFLHHCVLSLAPSKLRLCSANHRASYFSNLACDWLSTVWDCSGARDRKKALHG